MRPGRLRASRASAALGRCQTTEKVVRPEGLEPPTCGFEGRRSIQLSYGAH